MELSDVFALVGGGAALIGAGVAIWQAIEARRARNEARELSRDTAAVAAEANSMWKSIAESQKVVAQAHRPKAWGIPRHGRGDYWTIRNTSERGIVVERIDIKPEAAAFLLELEGTLPQLFRAGELIEFFARARLSLSIRSITVTWKFQNGDETHHSTRTLDSPYPARER